MENEMGGDALFQHPDKRLTKPFHNHDKCYISCHQSSQQVKSNGMTVSWYLTILTSNFRCHNSFSHSFRHFESCKNYWLWSHGVISLGNDCHDKWQIMKMNGICYEMVRWVLTWMIQVKCPWGGWFLGPWEALSTKWGRDAISNSSVFLLKTGTILKAM